MRRMHKVFVTVLIIGLVFVAGLVLADPSQAQNGPTWLPFNGSLPASAPSLALLQANAAQIELQAVLPGAYAETVTQAGTVYTRLSGEGFGYPAVDGLPEVPVLRGEVEIPFGALVSVEVLSANYGDNSLAKLGLHPIYPMQAPIPKVEGAEDNQPFAVDRQYYTSGALYPDRVVSLGEPYIIRGHRILPVEVWPVAYDPTQASLRLYSQISFRLVLSGADVPATRQLAERYASPEFDASLSRRVLNYNQGLPMASSEQVGYLIITADAYSAALDPFIQLKQSRGFEVTRTKTSDIPGGPTAANIKAYIKTAYQTWPIPPSYVLLVGDTDTIPTWTGQDSSTGTDIYYGTMDDGDDWHPDLGRGRFPVRSAAQASDMVAKYVFYAGLSGQEPWLKMASFPATCDNYTVAEGTHNYVINTYTAPGGWTGTFPENPQPGGDKLYCVSYNANHAELVEHFNQGRWAIIYSGHGSYGGWEMSYVPYDIQTMPENSMYPFVASHACLTGDFTQQEVFGETWVLQHNKGAMVFWGSTNLTYWDQDDWLERAMFDSLFLADNGYPSVATMTDYGLSDVELHDPGMARYYREEYNVLGDPSFKLFMEPELPSFTLEVAPSSQAVCNTGTVDSTVTIGSILNYSSTVYLENGPLPFNVSASFDPSQAQAPFTSTLTLDVDAGLFEGDHTIVITATDQVSVTLNANLSLRINTDIPSAPLLLSPADGATDQPFTPAFSWDELPLVGSYSFELATSPLFEAPLVSVGDLPSPDYSLASPLEGGKCYWWRAQANNACGTGAWAEPFHFNTVALGVSFYDDMEAGEDDWSHQASQGTDHWAIATDQAHSPTHAWFAPDDGAITDSRLWITDRVVLGAGSTLSFWHQYQFEGASFDGSVLEVSTDGGTTWSDLGPYITANGYTGTISSGYSNPLAGRQAWTGDLMDWTQVTVNLASFAGQDVLIRWRIGCDSSVSDVGWYIDDVQVTAPLPPNPVPTLLSISPSSGSHEQPTEVVISGTGFKDAPALMLGNTWLESLVLVDENTIQAVVPAGLPAGVYDLTLTNGDCQAANLADAFEVLADQTLHYIFMPLTVK